MEYTEVIDKLFKYLPILKLIYDKIRGIFKKKYDSSNTFILFIDDKKFPIVERLNDEGWWTKRVKDIDSINTIDIKRAQIIFVDCKGVGRKLSPSDQGIEIIKQLRKTYEDSKRIILYSEYSDYSLNPDFIQYAHHIMPKNSNLYDFITVIETQLKKIK